MPRASNNTAAKRFTYDWLIRFAELHPFEFPDHNCFSPPTLLYSNYSRISPLFTKLINQYMPYVRYAETLNIYDGVIREFNLPLVNKYKVYVCSDCYFYSLTPGELTWFQNNRVMFYGKMLTIDDSYANRIGITPDELRYLLKYGNFQESVELLADFAQPTKFSGICSLIQHCWDITLNSANLIFDENMADVLRETRFCPRKIFIGTSVIISDRAVLEMIDYFMGLPGFWFDDAKLTLSSERIEALKNVLVHKYSDTDEYVVSLSQTGSRNSICVSTSWNHKKYLKF